LFEAADKGNASLEALCGALVSRLATVERKELSEWLRQLLLGGIDAPTEVGSHFSVQS